MKQKYLLSLIVSLFCFLQMQQIYIIMQDILNIPWS